MKVKAIETGFYGEKRRRLGQKGSIFTLKSVSDFSPKWMRVVSATSAEKEELKKALKDRQARIDNPKAKRIIEVENKFQKDEDGGFDSLFEENAMDEGKKKSKAKAAAEPEAEMPEAPAVDKGEDEAL